MTSETKRQAALIAHFSTSNYGNHLVNLASKRILEMCGLEVRLVVPLTSRSEQLAGHLGRLPMKVIRLITSGMLVKRIYGRLKRATQNGPVQRGVYGDISIRRKARFEAFSSAYLNPMFVDTSRRRELVDAFDYFAVGSDQIWNFDYSLSSANFADFAPQGSAVCLSPSVGHAAVPLEWRRFYRRQLRRFAEVGVRELHWTRSFETSRGGPAFTQLVDPTLMLSPDMWSEYAAASSGLGGNVLLYELGGISSADRLFTDRVAETLGVAVEHLSESEGGELWASNASDFIAMVSSASCIVTDSYHGAIFAFTFDKPVVLLRRTGFAEAMNSRIDTLADLLNLSDRFIDNMKPSDVMKHDYATGRASLKLRQRDFWLYLERHGMDVPDEVKGR